AAGSRHRRRPEGETELPEQPPPLAELVAGAGGDEGLETVAVELEPLSEVADAGERPGALALLDDRPRARLAERLHVFEPDPHSIALEPALDGAAVDVDRPHLDSAPLRVAHERRRRVEAHRLRVQERREELARVVVPQPRRLVCKQPERRRVRLREA